MSNYVIRGYHFGYNDECFYVCGSRINSVYQDKAEAEAKYREMELAHARHAELGEQEYLFDGNAELIEKLDRFVFDRTGTHITDGDYVDRVTLPSSLSDDDVLAFSTMARMQAYKLVTFDGEPAFYSVWDSAKESYQMNFDECFEGLVYSESRDGALRNLASYAQYEWRKVELRGSLEQLTASPSVLTTLIASSPSLTFNETTCTLRANKLSIDRLISLNELLRAPLFEIRQLTLAQVQELEEELGEQY